MKLRLRGNTLRLRLTRSEVEGLVREDRIEEATRFGPTQALTWRLVVDTAATQPGARFDADGVTVSLPAGVAGRWASSDEVSIRHSQSLGDGQELAILVEKDFACLVEREGEDDSDAFPHPEDGATC